MFLNVLKLEKIPCKSVNYNKKNYLFEFLNGIANRIKIN